MRRARLLFIAIRVPIDYVMLIAAAFLTYRIRFESFQTIRPVTNHISLTAYGDMVTFVAAVWILLFALNGLYNVEHRRLTRELGQIISGCATGFVAVLLYLVFTQELFTSRFIILGTFLASIVFVSSGRLFVRILERISLRMGIGVTNLVLIGSESTRAVLRAEFASQPSLGYRVAFEYNHLTSKIIAEITAARKLQQIQGILLTDPKASEEDALEVINMAEDLHIRFLYSADLFATASANVVIHTVGGTPLIEPKRTRLDGWGSISKRLFDIVVSLVLLILLCPLFLVLAIIVLIETGRPVFFHNERVGEHGNEFDTLKFRSMYQKDCIGKQFADHSHDALLREAELIRAQSIKQGPVYKIKNDPRVTKVGRFLRRSSLDELPQLWNVFRGDMSLVGPRPHQPREVEQYSRRHRHVLAVRPGITGIAQISGRSNLDFEEEIRLDTYYIENWSLSLDLFILAKTPFVVCMRRGAIT